MTERTFNSTQEPPDMLTFNHEDLITITDTGIFVRREESLRTKFGGNGSGSGLRQVWFFRDLARSEFCEGLEETPREFVEAIIEALAYSIRSRFQEHRDDPDKL